MRDCIQTNQSVIIISSNNNNIHQTVTNYTTKEYRSDQKMRLSVAALWLLLTVWEPNAGSAFTAPPAVVGRHHSVLGASVIDQESTGMAAAEDETADSVDPSVATPMELKVINDLPFRLLRLACKQRGIDTAGTMGQLRARLRNYGRENDECTVDSFSGEPVGDCDTDFQGAEVRFVCVSVCVAPPGW